MTDRIRREGTKNLLLACIENHVTKYIQLSIIYLYGNHGDLFVDESTNLNVPPYVESAVDMENQIKDSNLDWCILRGGSFYGTATGQVSLKATVAIISTVATKTNVMYLYISCFFIVYVKRKKRTGLLFLRVKIYQSCLIFIVEN